MNKVRRTSCIQKVKMAKFLHDLQIILAEARRSNFVTITLNHVSDELFHQCLIIYTLALNTNKTPIIGFINHFTFFSKLNNSNFGISDEDQYTCFGIPAFKPPATATGLCCLQSVNIIP